MYKGRNRQNGCYNSYKYCGHSKHGNHRYAKQSGPQQKDVSLTAVRFDTVRIEFLIAAIALLALFTATWMSGHGGLGL